MYQNPGLEIRLFDTDFRNPTILASGVLGTSRQYFNELARHDVGGITIKSVSIEPREGHNNPVVLAFEAGLMNAVGYSNPGYKEAKKEFSNLRELPVPVFASIIGKDVDEFKFLCDEFIDDNFFAVELALSCPHTPGYGMLGGQNNSETAYKVTRAVKERVSIPVITKLSPNAPSISEAAKAAEEAGADAISACNTMGPGMLINIETARPFLDFKIGGVSGPALRPIAVRCVYEIYKTVKIPIIGIGGVTTGRDMLEMMMAGATAVGIGSAVYYRGVEVFDLIVREARDWLAQNDYEDIKDIIGLAHAE